MSKMMIEVEKLRQWQSKLEDIDGALSISEEMYDVLRNHEEGQRERFAKLEAEQAKKLQMKDVVEGAEYRISQNASFKQRFEILKGATVKVIKKKRTNVHAVVVSDISGFKGNAFNINVDVLETL